MLIVMAGLPEPTWESVEARRDGFTGWSEDRVRLDFLLEPPVDAGRVVVGVERFQESGGRGT